jgi:hypothetical protein
MPFNPYKNESPRCLKCGEYKQDRSEKFEAPVWECVNPDCSCCVIDVETVAYEKFEVAVNENTSGAWRAAMNAFFQIGKIAISQECAVAAYQCEKVERLSA